MNYLLLYGLVSWLPSFQSGVYSLEEMEAWIQEVNHIDPYDAAIIAAQETGIDTMIVDERGRPIGIDWLLTTSRIGSNLKDLRKDSRFSPKGKAIHNLDQKDAIEKAHRRYTRKGWISPKTCSFHRDPRDWSTRGPYELKAGYVNSFFKSINDGCFNPDWYDVPLFNAYASSFHAIRACKNRGKQKCTWQEMRCAWAGGKKCKTEKGRHKVWRKFRYFMKKVKKIQKERGYQSFDIDGNYYDRDGNLIILEEN